ncbi:hypothetical protein [Methyloraptor flagellatus]|jgi:hypothetical protein|uniref:Flagellar protein FlgJ N-terminal domain-containing protein n=1 Tax=Methyloraptor flagellatus TaxID=3162530 RepID=A0AAU7X5E4_9HYPH
MKITSSPDQPRLPSSDAVGTGGGPKMSALMVSNSADVSPSFLRAFRSDPSIGRFMNDRAGGRDLVQTFEMDFGKEIADLLFGKATAKGPAGVAQAPLDGDRFAGE